MRYRVMVNVSIQPIDEEHMMGGGTLSYWKNFELEGQNFTEIAPKIDSIESILVATLQGA